jgi:hypothetical protein
MWLRGTPQDRRPSLRGDVATQSTAVTIVALHELWNKESRPFAAPTGHLRKNDKETQPKSSLTARSHYCPA